MRHTQLRVQCWRQGLCPSDVRTNHSLVPMWLEFRADNVNADATSRLKGMASFSKLVSARRKWIVTRSVLSELVSHLIESQDWKRMQMTPIPFKRANADQSKLTTCIGTTLGPFLKDFWDEKLYCISQVRWYLRILQGAF